MLHKTRVTADLSLLHAPESEGVKTPGPLNKPITLHKVYDDKKLCLFPAQLRGQMRRTTQWGSARHTSLCKAFSPCKLRVWGFCLAPVIPEGSKQPAKNSPCPKTPGRVRRAVECQLKLPPELSEKGSECFHQMVTITTPEYLTKCFKISSLMYLYD